MASSFKDDPDYLGPISATPQKMVETMLSMAGVTSTDVVFDLGCNDARVLVTAASTAGARGVGVEIDEAAVNKARAKAAEAGVTHLVEVRHGNACAVDDLSTATVCFVYLLPKGNAKLSKKLMRFMNPGATVMTYVFRLPKEHWDEHLVECRAVASTRDRGAGGGVDTSGFNKVFMYRVPETKPDWCLVE